MSDPTQKWADNVHGKYYTDQTCIFCSLCADTAPQNFRNNDTEDHDICYKQPQSPEEAELCEKALGLCPVQAIGRDGDSV